MNNTPVHIIALPGLGDAIYQRPHIREFVKRNSNVYLETGFPQIFHDIPGLKFVRPSKPLPVYDQNVADHPNYFIDEVEPGAKQIYPTYGIRFFGNGDTIATAFSASLPLHGAQLIYDLPEEVHHCFPVIDTGGKPLAIVRPVTQRGAFPNISRAPLPEYVCRAAEKLMETHFVLLIANIDDEEEVLVGELPPHHDAFIHGELSIMEVIELMRRADCLVGGVGFIVCVALALKIPSFIILGGNGRFNAPHVLVDSRVESGFIEFAVPDTLCYCVENNHKCNKVITDFEERLSRWHQTILHSTT